MLIGLNGSNLNILGIVQGNLKYKDCSCVKKLYVISGSDNVSLSNLTSEHLGLMGMSLFPVPLLDKYPDLGKPLSKIN
ncbi:hypothetical protein PR048_021440 [Dryococelus australis]|uniref:Uncharacterized protein n=1 Tax=Dryococelus australis TaxID=614101 RepID=A0ABQ9GY73_9NEOP|nr:hypothetical protein PR048_021440 [Dryococelus australis]